MALYNKKAIITFSTFKNLLNLFYFNVYIISLVFLVGIQPQ